MPPEAAKGHDLPQERAFSLDPFQLQACAAVDGGSAVLVAAPTGAGKTIVAEHAVGRALRRGSKAFYTTPIKALSNQKFHDLVRLHGARRVGLLTGDNALNGDAPVVVMTTEVLRNMIYAGSPALEDLEVVVLDEVHYLQDAYRGPVWEEVIIHLPQAVQLVCLSATVSNADEVGDWLRKVRGPTEVIVEHTRPVELENLYAAEDRRVDEVVVIPTLVDGRANPEGRQFDVDPRGTWRRRRFAAPSRVDVVELLRERSMLPVLYFIFSRAACDDAVKACVDAGIHLAGAQERDRIAEVVEAHLVGLSDEDLHVLDFPRWFAGLQAGIGAHHAGLVPPFKEAVEECFLEGLVKVVFATETLALGINMPARSVVIEKLTKFTGDRHEFLTPAQYTQLTGRAGRRGIDTQGSALVAWSPFVTFEQVAGLAGSRRFELRSSFRPTYNMATNLVRRYSPPEAHVLLQSSFAQHQLDVRSRRRRGQGTRGPSLADTFDSILQLLEAWGHLDGWRLTPRGEQLVRIYHEADLLVAECLAEGLFDELPPEEVAALASCFTYEHRSAAPPPEPWYPNRRLRERFEAAAAIADELAAHERSLGLPPTRQPDPGFVPFAQAWAAGLEFEAVLAEEEMAGGDFVRNVKQLLDLLRQLGTAARSPQTRAAAASGADRMFRGVVAASSAVAPEGTWGEGADDDIVDDLADEEPDA